MNIARVKKKRWPRKTLGELLNFMEQFYPEGISLAKLSGDLKVSPQAVSNMFRRDDMRLSKACEIVSSYGYELHLYFPIKRLESGYTPVPPSRQFPNAGNLSGLVKYIQDSEYPISFVAEQANIAASTVARAFDYGDIQLSTLYRIVDALSIYVNWQFIKKGKDDEKKTNNT